jgi:hypothetical protein
MTHRITIKISQETEPQAVFTCDEPDTAWCRQNAVGSGEEPPENPLDCWFTVLASGLAAWGKGGIYVGPPTELRSGEVEFVRAYDESDADMCFWHYRGDVGQFPTGSKEVANRSRWCGDPQTLRGFAEAARMTGRSRGRPWPRTGPGRRRRGCRITRDRSR